MLVNAWLPISQSIVQGSGLGPYLYIIYAADLKPLHSYNIIVKYADDTTLPVAEHSAVDIVKEFKSLQDWSEKLGHSRYTIIARFKMVGGIMPTSSPSTLTAPRSSCLQLRHSPLEKS